MTEKIIDSERRPSPDYPFWIYDPEGDGMTFYRTEADRDEASKGIIDGYLDDGWSEEVENVLGGIVTHQATQTNRKEKPEELDEDSLDEDGEYWNPDWDYTCDYELKPLVNLK